MSDEIPWGYGILSATGVRILHQVSRRACAEVLAFLDVSRRPVQRSQLLQNLTILIVKSGCVLNGPPSLQVLSGARENALAESEITLQSSMGGWEHLEKLRSTGKSSRSVWEVCIWLPHRITFCWCAGNSESLGAAGRNLMEMVICTPTLLPQSLRTILLPDRKRQQWYSTTQRCFVLDTVANKLTAHLLPRQLCVVAAVTFLWITSSHSQPGIWSTISWRNRIMMLRRGAQIWEPSHRQKNTSKSLNRSFKGELSDSSNTEKSSETMLLVSLPIKEPSVVTDDDVAWLHEHDRILYPPAAGSLANRKRTSSHPAANQSLWGWNALAGQLLKDLCCGWAYFWLFGLVVLATVPDLDPVGIIGLRGNGLTTSKIDDFLSELSN